MSLIGFMSDAHGNVEAAEKGLLVLMKAGAEKIYFLGDAVGYLSGGAVVDLLAESGAICSKGNHEAMLLAETYGEERDAVYKLSQTRMAMNLSQIRQIKSWPDRLRIEATGCIVNACHGSPDDPIFGYVYPDTPSKETWRRESSIWFFANTHRPFVRSDGDCLQVNIGSVGLPRDCANLGSVCLFDTRARTARILRFDISSEIARAFERVGDVHPAVRNLAGRPASGHAFGELIDV